MDQVYEFTHVGELVNLNKAVSLAKSHYSLYSKMKLKADSEIRRSISRDLPRVRLKASPFALVCTWYLPATKNGYVRMDPDNVASAVKYLLDAMQPRYKYLGKKPRQTKVLVAPGLIENDNFDTVSGGILHRFLISPDGRQHVKCSLLLGERLEIPGICDKRTDKQLTTLKNK